METLASQRALLELFTSHQVSLVCPVTQVALYVTLSRPPLVSNAPQATFYTTATATQHVPQEQPQTLLEHNALLML